MTHTNVSAWEIIIIMFYRTYWSYAKIWSLCARSQLVGLIMSGISCYRPCPSGNSVTEGLFHSDSTDGLVKKNTIFLYYHRIREILPRIVWMKSQKFHNQLLKSDDVERLQNKMKIKVPHSQKCNWTCNIGSEAYQEANQRACQSNELWHLTSMPNR